jgi:hypothetical protein
MLVASPAFCQNKKKDTSFIIKEYFDSSYHIAYIDTNKKSNNYIAIANRQLSTADEDWYKKETLKSLQAAYARPLSLNNISSFPRKWCPIQLYHGKYYLYAPSDWGVNDFIHITDSTFIQFYFDDGPTPSAIESVIKQGKCVYHFNLFSEHKDVKSVDVYIIDTINNISVFKLVNNKGDISYKLMIDINKILAFPIIVNYYSYGKGPEIEFDKINFEKLIKKSTGIN